MEKNKLIKICYVITQGEIGGAQMYVRDLASRLPQDEFDITIAHGQKPNDWLTQEANRLNINTHYFKYIKRNINPFYEILGFWELKKYFKEQKFDIVHLNSSKIGALGSVAARQAGVKKIIFTCHGWAFDDPRPNWEKYVYNLVYKVMSKYIDKIITVSEYACRAGINRGLPQKKIVTIHNGLNIKNIKLFPRDEARKILNEKYHLPIDKKIIGTIANFYPTKGLKYLLAAAKLYLKKDPQTIFCIIGSGRQEKEYRDFIKQNKLQNSVFLLTNISAAGRLVTAFDLFVLSSLKECLPYVLFEAENAGLPIVTTDVGGNPEVLNYYPAYQYQLIKASEPEQIVVAITNMITKKNLPPDALEKIRNKISLDNMVSETAKLYY